MRSHCLAELGLGEEQEVVLAAAPGEEGRDHPRLRCEQKRLERLAGEDVVREHALQEVGCFRSAHAHIRARPGVRLGRDGHATSVGSVFRSKAEQKVRDAGYDPARLPPGQYITAKWPVLHAGEVPHTDLATWTFRVFGEVEQPIELTWQAFNELPRSSNVQDIHCVTRWSRFDTSFEGVHWRELAALCRPTQSAHYVVAHAEHGFTTNVPLASLEEDTALLATDADGEPLTPDHGWPLRLVVPGKYFWKSAKWLRGLELRATDEPGFWERYGYNNHADPWREERYEF